MLYLYRNPDSLDMFVFDSIRLIRYEVDDKRLDRSSYIDMKKRGIKTPYARTGIHYNTEDCIVLTKGGMLAVWYNWFTYIIEFDEAVYANDELICGAYNMRHKNLCIEYMYFDRKQRLVLGVGLKNGSIKITPRGHLIFDGEKYNGRYESVLAFKVMF